MLTRLDVRGLADPVARLPRPGPGAGVPADAVREILSEVKKRGDSALREFTERFDGLAIDEFRVNPADLETARRRLPDDLTEALDAASASITAFHREQVRTDTKHERDGIVVRELRRPVRRAGLYVPGGRARYPSTVLMTAIPARVAGVAEVALCVPAGSDGRVDDATLAAAALAEVDEVYRVGGAQAIAALAYGTETIAAVDVIVGPGNAWVATAKREVAAEGVVGVPSAFAGPSEVVVVADETVPAEYAAIDVVVQAEHGPDGLAWLVTWSDEVADAVTEQVARFVAASPRQRDIESTLTHGGYAVIVDGPREAIAVANAIAPEHLELMCEDAESLVDSVVNAGAVFCGPWAPASVGDYLAGPSHVLPTFGSARFSSALGVDDFVRRVHAISIDRPSLGRVAAHVATLADAEGLGAHAESVRIRELGE